MRTMEQQPRNIYKTARRFAGLTQERWAEAIGVSVDSVRCYENGSVVPADATVGAMCEISNHTALGYWHIRNKSDLAAETLPEVEELPLPQAVVQLLAAMREFDEAHHEDALLLIAADGAVTPDEEPRFCETVRALHAVIRAAYQIEFAEKMEGGTST